MSFTGQQLLVPHYSKNLLPYTLNFATSDFEAAWTAPNWAVSGGTAKNTPTEEELLTNGNFATWTGDNPNSWSVTGEVGADPMITQDANGARLYTSATAFNPAVRQNIALTTSNWARWAITIFSRVSGSIQYGDSSASGLIFRTIAAIGESSWVGRAGSSQVLLRPWSNVPIDLVVSLCSCRKYSALLAYRNFGATNVRVKASWTIGANYHAGVIARVSADGTQYLNGFYDRPAGTCNLLKVLTTGTTQLISIVVAYVAGANVEIRTSGNTIQLFYNNAQVGTDQTETTLSANTRHGLFSTDVSNTVSSINVVRN